MFLLSRLLAQRVATLYPMHVRDVMGAIYRSGLPTDMVRFLSILPQKRIGFSAVIHGIWLDLKAPRNEGCVVCTWGGEVHRCLYRRLWHSD